MNAANRVKVWDPAVRAGHWLLVALFATAYVTGEGDKDWHVYAGYGTLGIVAFRLLWGFIGTRYARFAEFLRGPRETLAYLKAFAAGKPAHYLGHNPAGGWMIVVLLGMLLMVSWTGLETYGAQGKGPLAKAAVAATLVAPAYADSSERVRVRRRRSAAERFWKELHEGFANATLLLALMHVAGAIAASVVHRENLIKSMFTGRKSM